LLLAITILFASLGATTATDTLTNDTYIEATAPTTIEKSTPIQESTQYSIEKDTTAQKDKKILKANNTQTIYANSAGNHSSDGSDIKNPTTITNALKLVQNNGEIHLVTSGDTDTYNTTRIDINSTNVINATNFSIIGQEGKNITLNGQNNHRLIVISSGYSITLKNIIIMNGYAISEGAIHNSSNLTIADSTLNNNNATDYGGASATSNSLFLL